MLDKPRRQACQKPKPQQAASATAAQINLSHNISSDEETIADLVNQMSQMKLNSSQAQAANPEEHKGSK